MTEGSNLQLETRSSEDPADLEALARAVAWSFGDDPASALEWLRRGEPGCVRVAERGGALVAGLLEVPMGQWFGGRRLSVLGVAGVSVCPEARGQGVALALVRATLRAARERQLALSMLYPSTFGLYRRAGYELAGSLCRFTLRLRELGRVPRGRLAVHGLGPDAATAVEAAYRDVARWRNGYLDRGRYVWGRVRAPGRAAGVEGARGFGVSRDGRLGGYVYARPAALRRAPFELALSDFVATDPDVFQSLLAFLAGHSTTAERVTWCGGPADARVLGLPERALGVALEEYWMLRVVHVEQALLSRGYPDVDAEVDLEVEDDVLPENCGTYALRVQRGVAELGAAPGGPRARLGVRALAALFSGFVAPRELALAGQLQADERALRSLGALFCGPAPACVDYF